MVFSDICDLQPKLPNNCVFHALVNNSLADTTEVKEKVAKWLRKKHGVNCGCATATCGELTFQRLYFTREDASAFANIFILKLRAIYDPLLARAAYQRFIKGV